MPLFTAQTARENAAKAHAARRANLEAAQNAGNHVPHPPQLSPLVADENLEAGRIAHAISLTLDKLEDPKTGAKDRAALSRSLRDLRETYHMVTGIPKPGQLRPRESNRRRPMSPLFPVIELAPDMPSDAQGKSA